MKNNANNNGSNNGFTFDDFLTYTFISELVDSRLQKKKKQPESDEVPFGAWLLSIGVMIFLISLVLKAIF